MHYLGREYMFHGKYNEAIDTLIKHLNLKSATWKDERCASMRFIARCYKYLKRYDEAKMWLDKAINEVFSWDNTIYDILSICMFNLNEIDKSLYYIDKAIDMEPNNERLLNNKKIIKEYKENHTSY